MSNIVGRMREALRGEPRVDPDALIARLQAVQRFLAATDGLLPDTQLVPAHTVVERAGTRLALSGHHTVVALAGATGSGKSTLLSLVPRLHEVTGGRITLDGHDLRDLRLGSLRRLVGVAFEEPTLFSMSVWENLTLGRPDAGEDEVRAALALAQAEFAYELPWGLATRVGEQGLSLSGGQRQRLALARAVLGRPALLVLDDPLSALDVQTEALVEAALRRVLRDTTALLVVHRPSTVALADRVALLDGGRIVAVGTHSELLAEVPAYRAVLSAEPDRRPGGVGLVRS